MPTFNIEYADRLINTKTEIKEAMELKGIDMSDDPLFEEYPRRIESLTSGVIAFEDKYADTIARWEVKCLTGTAKEYGRYNSTSGLFEANEFDSTNSIVEDRGFDLDTAMEMLKVFESPQILIPNYYQDTRFKTTLSICGDSYQIVDMIGYLGFYQSTYKSIRLTTDLIQPIDDKVGGSLLYYTRYATSMLGIIRFRYPPSLSIQINGLINFTFIIGISDVTAFDFDMSAQNTVASYDSLHYLIEHWGDTTNPLITPRTLTLHADIIDKITNINNSDYAVYSQLSTLAVTKNISIA